MRDRRPVALPTDDTSGVRWRPPVKADVPAIVALQDACYDVDNTHRTTPSEILDHWGSQSVDPPVDALMGFTADGQLVATIWSIVSSGVRTKRRGFGYENRIHPEHRTDAIRDFALAWWEARCRQRFAEHDDELPRLLYQYVYQHLLSEIAYYESRGYEIVRHYHELGRDLRDPLGPVSMTPGIEVRSMEGNRDDALTVHNAAFRDHWGSQPVAVEQWSESFAESYLPDASYVAYDGEVPVAYLLSVAYPHDFVDRGWPHFWIDGVGTKRSHRGRGIASSLIAKAMRTMKNGGMEYAILGVDAESPTGAYGVYEALGFRQLRGEIALEKKA